jgi:NAD+ synthase
MTDGSGEAITRYREEIVAFIRDYMKTAGLSKGVLGLSGGVDSALCYVLACEALGPQNVVGVLLPTENTGERFLENARLLVEMKGGVERTIDITPVVDRFERILSPLPRSRLGNIAARVRMIFLYDVSAEVGGLVIGTGNRTELLLGYFTVFGDGGCGMEPIGDLYKTEVWEMAKLVGVPDRIIEEKPTAGLWKGQTDEGELGLSYSEADAILRLLVDGRFTAEQVEKGGFDRAKIDRVISLMGSSRYKRRMPPVARLRQTPVDAHNFRG